MFKKTFITFGTSIAILITNMIGGILTARLLGPTGKGQLTAVTLWPNVFATIGSLGLTNSVVYFASKSDDQKVKTIWAGTISIGIILSILLGTLGFFLLPFLMKQYSGQLIWTARFYLLFIPLNLFTLFGLSIFQGKMEMMPYNTIRFSVTGFYLIGIIILAFLGRVTVESCSYVLLFSNLFILILVFFLLGKRGWLGKKIDGSLNKKMITYGIKSHIGSIFSLLNLRMDQMVMAIVLPPNLLGLYAVAVTFSSGVSIISNAIATSVFPMVSTQNLPEKRKQEFATSVRITFWSTIFSAIIFLTTTHFLITLFFGREYSGSAPSARVLVVAAVAMGMNMTLASGIKGYGKPFVPSVGELISLFFTAILLWFLLPRWNIMGAAIASLISYSCNTLYMLFYIWKNLSIKPRDTLILNNEDFKLIRSYTSRLKKYFTFRSV